MGKIHLEDMEFYAYHGHYKEEQIVGNRFLLDLIIETDMTIAAASDQLEDAVNYQAAYELVKQEMEKTSSLLEHIAKRILDAIFENLKNINSATLTIRKMNPPMGGKMRAVSVSLSREAD